MDENPSPGSSRNDAMRRHRNRQALEEDDGVDKITCTGKSCQSCTAGVIADCVAICCCPCAVVNLLALAFIKLPWMVGRKCFGMGKKTRQLKEKKRKCERSYSDCCGDTFGISGKGRVNGGTVLEIVSPEEEPSNNFSAEFDSFEDGEIFHLGFGRVSFTGIPCETKGN